MVERDELMPLVQDVDSRVREATHKAFEQLIGQVGRSLARHLRSLMGPWLVAQSDSYAPAASAAVAAFNAAFSVAKQREAVAFCRLEVIAVSTFVLSSFVHSSVSSLVKCSISIYTLSHIGCDTHTFKTGQLGSKLLGLSQFP